MQLHCSELTNSKALLALQFGCLTSPLTTAKNGKQGLWTRGIKNIYIGCIRLGNQDLDFQNLNPDFPIECEIRKWISPPRNPSFSWISIKKSKSGFHGFPFYRSIGKSEKGFAKLFSWTVVFFLLSMRAYARLLTVLKDNFSNPFLDFPIEG